jgi:hypothetical protein
MNQVNGLPTHILLVHAVVVLVPISAALLVAAALWPAARRRLGLATPVVAVLTFLTIPVATQAGEWLQARVPDTELVREHAEMGNTIIPFGLALVLLAALVWWRGRRTDLAWRPAGPGTALAAELRTGRDTVAVLVAVAAVLVAVGAVVQVVRIGDSGAKASWQDKVSTVPHAVPGEG